MSGVDLASLAVLALTNRLVEVGVAPLRASEVWRVIDGVGDPSTLVGQSVDEVTVDLGDCGIDAQQVVARLDSGLTLAARLDTLSDRGIWAITPFDAAYPQVLKKRLAGSAPVVLFGAGAAGLLSSDEPEAGPREAGTREAGTPATGEAAAGAVGIVGSRNVGHEGAEVAASAGSAVAKARRTVISGSARGVDQFAMTSALDAGGSVVGVLADSLERALSSAQTRRALIDGRACLVTPYGPDVRFTAGNALGRNKIIYGLADVTLVVAAAQGTGGSWSGATEALGKGFGPVAVWRGAGEGPGNGALQHKGAVAITEVEQLLALPGADVLPAPTPEVAVQLSLVDPPPPKPPVTNLG